VIQQGVVLLVAGGKESEPEGHSQTTALVLERHKRGLIRGIRPREGVGPGKSHVEQRTVDVIVRLQRNLDLPIIGISGGGKGKSVKKKDIEGKRIGA